MTKYTFNYCVADMYEQELQKWGKTVYDLVRELGVDGIEQFVYQLDRPAKSYKDITIGTHLSYWPYWMDFWLGKQERLQKIFPGPQDLQKYFFGATNKEEWLEVIRKNILAAATENPEYMVWHVSESTIEEVFTYKCRYDSYEILQQAAKVFNQVADVVPSTTTILFENLWWPGLNLLDPHQVEYFFERIESKNVGIMLDTGHLLNTNPNLRTEAEGADYVCRMVERLGEGAELIKGIHLSCSLSGDYQRSFVREVPKDCNYHTIWQHLTSIDQHRPFVTAASRQIIDFVQPDYVLNELAHKNLHELYENVKIQSASYGG